MIDTKTYGHAELTSKVYEKIENLVVDLYIELKIKNFPINPFEIAKQKGYEVIPYSQLKQEACAELRNKEINGLSLRTANGSCKIFYDDSHCKARQRFTIMHEIGHIQLGHKEDSEYAEKCANYYAAYALVPTPMIYKLDCEDFMCIADKYDVSYETAMYAFDRFNRWRKITCKVKPYESKLLEYFE